MKSNIARMSCGSPHYVAPEVMRDLPYDGRASDIWSAGVILFATLTGRLPFNHPSIRTVLALVRRGEFTMPRIFSPPMQKLISEILTVSVRDRLTLSQIKSHPAFRIGLPRESILPVAVMTKVDHGPVPRAKIKRDFIATLRDIGYPSDEAVIRELSSNGFAMAKVFLKLFSHQNPLTRGTRAGTLHV
jgi:BR serine/threonine kinase